MASPDLTTTYLGLHLSNPYIAGASPLGDHLDSARRLEDAGCAAIVLHSLFEEQISEEMSGRIHGMDVFGPEFSDALKHFPKRGDYPFSPDAYLNHLRKLKEALSIPVIASLNGTSPHVWLSFATQIADAGADALEINPYEVVTDPDQSAASIEHWQCELVRDLKHVLKIPVAVKISPFYTALAHVAREFERAGASGLVLFNRFLQPDIDVDRMTAWPHLELSTSAELPLRLRWLAILRAQSKGSLAASGGVETPADGIKAILAGADVVQLVSTILRHGPAYFGAMREGLSRWLEALHFATIADVRGRLSFTNTENPAAYERAQYMRTLAMWDRWIAYQSMLHADRGTRAS